MWDGLLWTRRSVFKRHTIGATGSSRMRVSLNAEKPASLMRITSNQSCGIYDSTALKATSLKELIFQFFNLPCFKTKFLPKQSINMILAYEHCFEVQSEDVETSFLTQFLLSFMLAFKVDLRGILTNYRLVNFICLKLRKIFFPWFHKLFQYLEIVFNIVSRQVPVFFKQCIQITHSYHYNTAWIKKWFQIWIRTGF